MKVLWLQNKPRLPYLTVDMRYLCRFDQLGFYQVRTFNVSFALTKPGEIGMFVNVNVHCESNLLAKKMNLSCQKTKILESIHPELPFKSDFSQ